MTKTIENLFQFLHLTADILIIALFVFRLKRTKNESGLFLIALYTFLDFLLNIVNTYFSFKLYLYSWSTFTLVEYSIFTYIIWSNIKKVLFRKLIAWLSFAFIIFTVIFNVTTNFKSMDSIPIGVETIFILLFSFYYLYEQMNDASNPFIYTKYQFWVVTGFMIYLAGSFFVFLFASRVKNELLRQYWFLTNCFYVIMIILFGISFFVHGKKKKKKYSNNFQPYLS